MLAAVPWQVYVVVLVALTLPFVYKFYEQYKHDRLLDRAGLSDLRQMSKADFDRYLERLFSALGYQVQRASGRNAPGVDLVLVDGTGRRTAVSSARWREPVDAGHVHEVVESATFYECQESLVVTTGRFTNKAISAAEESQTHLWDAGDLADAMDKVRSRGSFQAGPSAARPAAAAGAQAPGAASTPNSALASPVTAGARTLTGRPAPASPQLGAPLPRGPQPLAGQPPAPQQQAATYPGAPKCPACGAPMAPRAAAGRAIWLCSRFPRCNGAKIMEEQL